MLITDGYFEMEAWRVPPLGQTADEDLPRWLVDLMTSGRIRINMEGGLDMLQVDLIHLQWRCLPGDYLIKRADTDWIKISWPGEFEELYDVI